MTKRLPLIVRHVMYNLRGGFLIRPLGIALSLGVLGAVLSWAEEAYAPLGMWLPSLLFPSHSDPLVAQAILSDIATSVMTVVSIVFAILLMSLTLASMQFSPRIIVSFSTDRVTQRTLGVFLGTFCYCMAALPAVRTVPRPFAPIFTVAVAMLLAVLCVCGLLYFIHHISHAISVNYIVDRIAAETEDVIDNTMPAPRRPRVMDPQPPMAGIPWDSAIVSQESGYIRFAELDRLFGLARTYRVKIRVVRGVGQFIPAGTALLKVSGSDRLPADAAGKFRAAFDIGPSRTLQQDVEFGVLQIVDIALKAISPAVNDPSTAINCIDQLSRILIRFASREPPQGVLYDLPGQPRAGIDWISFDQLLNSALEQIRHYGAADVAVCLRLLRAVDDVAKTTEDGDYRRSLRAFEQHVIDGCTRVMQQEHVALLHERMARSVLAGATAQV